MSNYNKLSLFAVITFFLLSCNEAKSPKEENHHQLISFPLEVRMEKHKLKVLDLDIFKNPEVLIYDTILFVLDMYNVNGFIRAYDIKTFEKIAEFGIIGRGPHEFLSPGSLTLDKHRDCLWFLDAGSLSFHSISINSILKAELPRSTKKADVNFKFLPIMNFHILKNGSVLITTSSDSAYYTAINSLGQVEKTWGEPKYPRTGIDHQMDYNYFYYKNLAYNEQLNVALSAYHFHEMIVRYDFGSRKKEIFTKKGFELNNPITSPKGNVLNREKVYTFQIKHNDSFVFASYLGGESVSGDRFDKLTVNYPYEIHVFDWNAQPIAKLVFHDPIISFDICSEGKIFIYANSFESPLQIYKLDI